MRDSLHQHINIMSLTLGGGAIRVCSQSTIAPPPLALSRHNAHAPAENKMSRGTVTAHMGMRRAASRSFRM